MLDFRKKKKIRKLLSSPIILIILAVILVILLKSLFGAYQKEKLSMQNLEKEKIELEKLSLRAKNLASSIEYLKTDQGIEDEIRSKFRAVKEGEKVAVIIDNETSSIPVRTTSTKSGFWDKIFFWFK